MHFNRNLLRLTLALVALLLIACSTVVICGLDDDLHSADLAVVLGNKVERDGTPSPALQARLDRTIELYRQNYFSRILVSGAHGKEGYDEPRVMARYLVEHGVPENVIYQDNEGINTWATAKNTSSFLKQHQITSVLIISQYFHLPRCRLAFAKFGITPAYGSHAQLWSLRDFYSVPREVIGYTEYYFRSADRADLTLVK